MMRDWENREQSEAGAVEGLSERSARLLERLSAKLARHDRGAEALAQTMQMKRPKS